MVNQKLWVAGVWNSRGTIDSWMKEEVRLCLFICSIENDTGLQKNVLCENSYLHNFGKTDSCKVMVYVCAHEGGNSQVSHFHLMNYLAW
jgi:hypothetical protein